MMDMTSSRPVNHREGIKTGSKTQQARINESRVVLEKKEALKTEICMIFNFTFLQCQQHKFNAFVII